MVLTVLERLIILKLLPQEGNITTNKLVRSVMDDVGFTGDELTMLKFVNLDDGRTQWDAEAAKDCRREFEFGPVIYKIVKEQLQTLSEQGKLPLDANSLWDKFMEKTKLAVVGKEPENERVAKEPEEERVE